jgi:hypothetical protein
MKRLVPIAGLIALGVFMLARRGVSFGMGMVMVDEPMLTQRVQDPIDMTVLGIADVPSGTPADLISSAVRRLRVVGLLRADGDAIAALRGKIEVYGATETRDS